MSNSEKNDVDPMRARYEELAELAGSLAHEIKNPLSVIHMNIDLLSEDIGRDRFADQPPVARSNRHRPRAVRANGGIAA